MFAYCGNNPVNRIDISGADSESISDIDLTNDVLDEKENGKSTGSQRTIPASNDPGQQNPNHTSPKPKRGMQNPKVREAVQKGQIKHKNMDYGLSVEKEKTIAQGNRVDGFDLTNHIIYELKPNNYRAIVRGQRQLMRYTMLATELFGGTWIGILITYD